MRVILGSAITGLGLLACGPPPADLVLRGGVVYTVDSTRPWAEALAVSDGRIVFVGTDADAAAWVGRGTRVIDLGGAMVLPGFHDTHVHPVTGGIELGACNLNDLATRDAVMARIAQCARDAPAGEWVRGGGWSSPMFPGGSPSRRLLDSLVPDHPAYLTSLEGHSAWVNTRALALAGVTAETPEPPSGRIDHEWTGQPGGTLRESAMELVARHLPRYSGADHRAGLRRALALAARFGITSLHEASADPAILAAYHEAERDGELTARVVVALEVNTDADPVAEAARLAELRDRYAGALVRPVAAKIFLDGVIEGGTAALLVPYVGTRDDRGELNVSAERLDGFVRALDSAGFKVHVHAIGDRAIRVALDAFAAQQARDGGTGPRHIMAHLQLFDPADLSRPAELGVVASFQPLWAYADTYITDLTEPRLGPARSRWLYPIATVARTGAIVAAGSDWSVTSMNPLRAVQVAVTRRDPDLAEGPAWIPEERVSLETIIRAYTLGGAFAGDSEQETGSITVGKVADLVVLDRNLFGTPESEIHRARVLRTMLGGQEVYRDSALR
jgi:predicted amidohydrolase YtcJ